MHCLARKSLIVAHFRQLVQRVQILVLFVLIHGGEETGLFTVVDPFDFEDFEARRSDEFVQLRKHLPS